MTATRPGQPAPARVAGPWQDAEVMVLAAPSHSSYVTGEVVSVGSRHA